MASVRNIKEWSKEELELLKELFAKGYTYSIISQKMNRTENSVASKLRHMGMGRTRRPTFLRYL